MTTIASIAQRILDENGLTLAKFVGLTLTILEYKIDDAIDYVNMQASLEIAHLTGDAETKSIVGTDAQILTVKWLTNLMLKAYKEKGHKISLGSYSPSYVVNNPDDTTSTMIFEKMIEKLIVADPDQDLPFVVGEATCY